MKLFTKQDSIKKGSGQCESSVELHVFSIKGSRVGEIKNFLSYGMLKILYYFCNVNSLDFNLI